MKVRKSDNVLVIAGNYVGKNGKVLKVFREK
ncbi:MAG: KOW motif-containing protein, partial [Bacteroidota bacterium]